MDEIGKTWSGKTFAVMAASLAIDYILSMVPIHFGWMLYLDSVGTIFCAALCGVLPGMVVGMLYNCIGAVGNPVTLYYGLLSILIAAAAALFSKRGMLRSFGKSVLTVPAFALIGGTLGSVMTWMLYGLQFGDGIAAPMAIFIKESTKFSGFFCQILADTGVDIVDKGISVLLVFAALKMIPRDMIKRLPYGGVYCADGDISLFDAIERAYRKKSLRTKIAVIIVMTTLLISSLATFISYSVYSDVMTKRYFATCDTTVSVMRLSIDADKINTFLRTKKRDADYIHIERSLYRLKQNIPEILYMYVYQIRQDGCHVVFDLDTANTKGSKLGEVVQFDDMFKKYIPDMLQGREIKPIISVGQYGYMMSVYKPLYDSRGHAVAYAAADIAMRNVISDRFNYLVKIISLLFGISIIMIVFTTLYAQRNIVVPLNSLSAAASHFAYDSEKDIKDNTKRIMDLRINTGDEIENLYSAISKTTADVSQYISELGAKSAEIAKKADTILKLQDNIIIGFANMVESRDENTGGHIRRTSLYVKAIAQAMYDKGMDRDIITPEYITKIEKSAPLHDIGKVRIPDGILNKPGRLDEHEMSIMKKHTSAGREIIEMSLVGIEGDNNLTEAMSMAECHHEWWNGVGYPNGISGSAIPLSARIMAVADVFDALLSKRSYKEGVAFDKAVSIIKEGSGTHFDPEVVTAFMSIRDELRHIADTQGKTAAHT